MNKLLIIGNGFDLAHGLNTRYSDFLRSYFTNVLQKAYSNEGCYEDDLIEVVIPTLSDEILLSSIDLDIIIRSTSSEINYKSDFFKNLVMNHAHMRWVDFESEYYSHLRRMVQENESQQGKYWELTKQSVEGLNKDFDSLKKLFIQYMQSIKIDGTLANKELGRRLKLIFGNRSERKSSFQELMILNFNYTRTIEIYSQMTDANMDRMMINIHGDVSNENNPVIFGYGDEKEPYYEKIENLNNNEFLRHIKSFFYFQTSNYRRLIEFLEAKDFNVYILGHSCGISDRVLLNSIFEHINCKRIQIYFHRREDGSTDYFEKTQEISRHFGPENKAKMRQLIAPFPECPPLS